MMSLAAVWDVEERLAEKAVRTPIKLRQPPTEVLGGGFVGFRTESWQIRLFLRPEHDPVPSLMMTFQSSEKPRDLTQAREILESMSVVRPGE